MNKILKTIIVAGGILTVGCIALGVIAVAINPSAQQNTAPSRAQPAATSPPIVSKPTSPTEVIESPTIAATAPPVVAPEPAVKITGKLLSGCKLSVIYEPDTSKKLVAVSFTFRNNSPKEVQINPLDFWLIDADGFVYKTVLGSCDEQVDVMKIAPGQAVQGVAGFHLPPNAKPTKIQYKTGYTDITDTADLEQ